MDERKIIISTRESQKMGKKELICYIIGVLGGILLLVYPGRLLYKVFGVGILLCEAMIFFTSMKDRKTYITVYEDGVVGTGYSVPGNKLADFDLKFREIKKVRMKDAFVVIETKSGSYKCHAASAANEVSLAISRRTK